MAAEFKQQKISDTHNTKPEQHKLNQAEDRLVAKTPKSKRKRFSCFFIFLIILFSVLGSILASGNDSFLGGVKNSYLVRQITHILYPGQKLLKGEADDRINFLLLGMGGEGHDGPYLTDTIIIASFKPSTKEAALFSVPRDMVVLYKNSYTKINNIYTYGQQDGGQGGELMKQVVSDTFNIPIHYYGVVDFEGFIKIIDSIGGIKVTVDKAFSDYQFPTADYKTQTISFSAGEQKMNGLTALRFARSRHGNNGEGSDFGRIKRQQKILLAMKEKITSFNTWINPKKITSIFSLMNQYTKTDMEPWEAVKIAHLAKGLKTQDIITQSIDDRPGSYLISGIASTGAYILQPIGGNYTKIQELVKNIFNFTKIPTEQANILILNGTTAEGLALKALNYLQQMGYHALGYGNDTNQNKVTTAIYSYNNDKPYTQKSLENIFQTKVDNKPGADYAATLIAQKHNIKDEKGELAKLDFVIVLGLDQQIDESKLLVPTIDPSLLSSTTASTTPGAVSTTPAFNGIINE